MTGPVANFSFPCYRRLFRYLGETDAMVELTELAARSFLSAANKSGDVPAFLTSATKKHGVRVNLAEVECLPHHLARTYIVIVDSAVDRFLKEFRQEHISLYQQNWTGDRDGKDSLHLAFENLVGSRIEGEARIGGDIISRFQYYRNARDWIVHEMESSLEKPAAKFSAIIPYALKHQELFRTLAAPNLPDKLAFDDFVLFSRLTKLVAEQMCYIASPPPEHWTKSAAFRKFKRFQKNPQRMQNAISGKLRTDYGMDEPTARWIAGNIYDSLA